MHVRGSRVFHGFRRAVNLVGRQDGGFGDVAAIPRSNTSGDLAVPFARRGFAQQLRFLWSD